MNKRTIIIVIALVLSLTMLCSCKSQEAKDAEACINDIGAVTMDSLDAIEAAEAAVAKVPADKQDSIENLDVLKQARNEYAELAYGTIVSGDKIRVSTALKMIGDYTGTDQNIIALKSDLEAMKSWGGRWYQDSKYFTKLDFYLEDGDYCFSINYGGYIATINDGCVVGNDTSRAEGIATSDDLGGQTFHIKFGTDSMSISWADGSIYHTLARE